MAKLSMECLRALQNSQAELQAPPKAHEELKYGITTRVLALKLRQRDEELSNSKFRSGISLTSRTTSSRFLQGVSVPNSIVKSASNQLQTIRELDDKDSARARRNQFVQDLVTRMNPKLSNQLKADSETPETNEMNVGTSPTKLSVDTFEFILEESANEEDDEEKKLRESRRIARRTSSLLPFDNSDRPTLESIQQAIRNTPTIKEIINIDTLNEEGQAIVGGPKKVSPNPSMVMVFSNVHPSLASTQSKSSKNFFKTKPKKTSSITQKPVRSSILRDSSKPSTKPHRSVSINETKTEDSQTQTYLKMMHIKPMRI